MDKIKNEQKIKVFIEIEKHSNIKYEYNKEKEELIVDRILPYPFFYPYAYGFIPNTKAKDNDELDILIISDSKNKIYNNEYYNVYIIGCLVMEDEKGMDEKILCVLEEDYEKINDIEDLNIEIKNNIYWFFSNYKSKCTGKWSKVNGYINKELSYKLYENSLIKE